MNSSSGMREAFDRVVECVPGGGRLLAALDFDGTLTDFEAHPSEAHLGGLARVAIEALLGSPSVRIGIISSRAGEDLAQVVPLAGVELVASNGLERVVDGQVRRLPGFTAPDPAMVEAVRDLVGLLPAARLEVKPAGLAVHFRRLTLAGRHQLETDLNSLAASAERDGDARGRWVACRRTFEWMPATAGKDLGVRMLLQEWHLASNDLPLYAGDDAIDEAALMEVRGLRGIAIGVGRHPPRGAEFRLQSPSELAEFLWRMALVVCTFPRPGRVARPGEGSEE